MSTHLVAYLLPADIVSRRPSCRLSDDNQPRERNKKVAGHPRPEYLAVQDTKRREVALSAKR